MGTLLSTSSRPLSMCTPSRGIRRRERIVRHHHNRLALLCCRVCSRLRIFIGRSAIQIAGGLVADEQ